MDAALALLVLNFVPDADRAVAEMRRVTRPGGVLAAAVWDYGERMQMLRILWDAAARLDPTVAGRDEATMPLGRPGGLIDLWQRSGLDEVDGSRVGVSTGFVDFDDYWTPFLQGQGPAGAYVAGLSDDARAALRDEVAATVGDGPFDLSATAWWVRGTVPARAGTRVENTPRVLGALGELSTLDCLRRAGTTSSRGARARRGGCGSGRGCGRQVVEALADVRPGRQRPTAPSSGSSRAVTQPSCVAALATMCAIGVTMCELPK